MEKKYLPILQVGDVLLSPDILTERFCCDYEKCKGACCIEGNAGAPVSLDEIGEIEDSLDAVWADLSASAQSVIDRQGVAYNDPEGEFNALVSVIEEELKKEPEPELSVAEMITAPLVNDGKGNDVVGGDEEDDTVVLPNNNEESIPHGADAMVDYWQRLRDYLEKCFKLGKVINIKYVSSADSPELLERVLGLPYQKMVIKHITDESIEARFEDMPSPYKIYIKNIVAYKDE